MMQLDIRTITLVGMATAMLFSMLGVIVARGRHTCPGFGCWTLANLCASLALLLLGLDGVVPYAIGISVGNTLAVGACLLVVEGSRRFCGKSGFWWPGAVVAVPTLALICYYGLFVFNM